jgi:hypothetical protein
MARAVRFALATGRERSNASGSRRSAVRRSRRTKITKATAANSNGSQLPS